MKEGQNDKVRRGQDRILRFTVAASAGATAAQWYLAATDSTPVADQDLRLSTGGNGVTIADQGADLIVEVALSAAQTEALPVGRRFHQLWITDVQGKALPVAEGTFTVVDSLKL